MLSWLLLPLNTQTDQSNTKLQYQGDIPYIHYIHFYGVSSNLHRLYPLTLPPLLITNFPKY
jgi:hypothetical protein